MTPKHTAKVLSRVSKSKKAVLCLMEKIYVPDQLHSGMSYGALTVSSMLMNQQYILNKVSLNRNTHKTKLCIDWLMKMLCPDAHRNLTLRFP